MGTSAALRWSLILILLVLVTLSSTTSAQRPTIPDMVAQGSSVRVRTAPSGAAPSLAEILEETDVVVRGIVGDPVSYLSEDQRNVYTDYPILKPAVLYGAEVSVSKTPGAPFPLMLTQLGGTVTVNQVRFTQTEEGLPPLRAGMEGVFLLKRTGNRLFIAGTFYGAFRVSKDNLKPLTSKDDFAREYHDVPTPQAVEKLVAELRKSRK